MTHAGGRKVVLHVRGTPRERAHWRTPLRAHGPALATDPCRYALPLSPSTAGWCKPSQLGSVHHPRARVAHAQRRASLCAALVLERGRILGIIGDVVTWPIMMLQQTACNRHAQPDSCPSIPFQACSSASASGAGSGSGLGSQLARLRADAVEVVHAAARRPAGLSRGLPRKEQVSPGVGALALARRPGPRRPRLRGARRRRRPGRGGRMGAARAVCRQPARGRQVGRGRQRGGARRRRPSLLMEVRRGARMAVAPCIGCT